MAKKKLDKDMINGVSGGEIGMAMDGSGHFEVLDRNGRNVFADGRTFESVEQAAQIATAIGENTTYLTFDERARRQGIVPGEVSINKNP